MIKKWSNKKTRPITGRVFYQNPGFWEKPGFFLVRRQVFFVHLTFAQSPSLTYTMPRLNTWAK